MTRAMQDWQRQPLTAPWTGIVPSQRLESFSVLSRDSPSFGNTLIQKQALSFAPRFPWEFTVLAKYAAKLKFYVFAPDKIVWNGVQFTPDTAFDSIPRTQAILREWRKYPRRAPWGWGLRQMDGLEDTSESLSWRESGASPPLLIKLYDGTRIEWQRQRWFESFYRMESVESFCQTPLRFLGLCY